MAKIIHYRDKCIGCGVCYEMQPEIWRMSTKDGKATLLRATQKKSIHILPLQASIEILTKEVAKACPVKIIKIV
jgi:ferredoxin